MDSVVKTIETAAGVEDDDPGEFLAVYECVYAGKPKPKKSPAEDDASSDADDDDADASSPSGPSTAAERMAKERFCLPTSVASACTRTRCTSRQTCSVWT